MQTALRITTATNSPFSEFANYPAYYHRIDPFLNPQTTLHITTVTNSPFFQICKLPCTIPQKQIVPFLNLQTTLHITTEANSPLSEYLFCQS